MSLVAVMVLGTWHSKSSNFDNQCGQWWEVKPVNASVYPDLAWLCSSTLSTSSWRVHEHVWTIDLSLYPINAPRENVQIYRYLSRTNKSTTVLREILWKLCNWLQWWRAFLTFLLVSRHIHVATRSTTSYLWPSKTNDSQICQAKIGIWWIEATT